VDRCHLSCTYHTVPCAISSALTTWSWLPAVVPPRRSPPRCGCAFARRSPGSPSVTLLLVGSGPVGGHTSVGAKPRSYQATPAGLVRPRGGKTHDAHEGHGV